MTLLRVILSDSFVFSFDKGEGENEITSSLLREDTYQKNDESYATVSAQFRILFSFSKKKHSKDLQKKNINNTVIE